MKVLPPLIAQLEELELESLSRRIPIVGREKGTWLHHKVKEAQPRHILELGTANGYSGIILGSEGGELTTIEINSSIAQEARENFAKLNVNARIVMGDAIKIVEKMVRDENNLEAFDLIFIDFAKEGYMKVLENCLRLVKKGGFIVADNITFPGCQDYRKAVLKHPQLKTEIIEIKDGLSCSERVK